MYIKQPKHKSLKTISASYMYIIAYNLCMKQIKYLIFN